MLTVVLRKLASLFLLVLGYIVMGAGLVTGGLHVWRGSDGS